MYLNSHVPKGGSVYIVSRASLIYAAIGRPSPQPLLWLIRGVTYHAADSSLVDRLILDSLRGKRVQWFVLSDGLEDFPQTLDYITERSGLVIEIGGLFDVRRLLEPSDNLEAPTQ